MLRSMTFLLTLLTATLPGSTYAAEDARLEPQQLHLDEAVEPVALASSIGGHRTALLLVNFPSNTSEPWTLDFARGLLATADAFVREASYGQASIEGEAFGWYTLDIPTSPCNLTAIANAAQAAAAADGVDVASYAHLMFAFPNVGCPLSAGSTVGGSPSYAWLEDLGAMQDRPFVHELLHGFGLTHSGALECGLSEVEGDCHVVEVGDWMDVMGLTRLGHPSAPQKEKLGWLIPQDVTADGTYILTPYEAVGANSLRILRSTNPVTGQRTWLYVERRQAIGFDVFLATPSPYPNNVLNGVVVHMKTEQSSSSSLLLDMTPGSQDTFARDSFDGALEVDQTFADPATDLTITTDAVSSEGATVTIAGVGSCALADPTLAVSPTQSKIVRPGTRIAFTLTLTNLDDPSCSDSTFDLSVAALAGWTATLANASLALASGASKATKLQVTSPKSVAPGSYAITVTASNRADLSFEGSATATYVVK